MAFALIQPRFTGLFPGIAGLLPTVGAALIVLLNTNNRLTQLLASKPLVWIGALSYSLYLWHWPVLAFMRYYTGAEILNWQYNLAFIALTLALATASFYWIETPLRSKRSKIQLLGYASLTLLLVITVVGMKKINAYYTPEPLSVEYTRYGDDSINCHGHLVGDCLRGDLKSNKEVLVLGDSHAAMLNHFFDYVGKELGFKARIITASSCVTIPEFNYQRIAEWAHESCLSQIEEVKKHLDKAETIFIAASWNWHMQSQEFNQALTNFLKKEALQAHKYLVSQEPLLNRHPLRNQRFTHLGIGIRGGLNQDYLRTNQLLRELTDKATYLALDKLDLFKYAPIWEKHLIYYDEHHLNEIGVIEYAKQALPTIKQEVMNAN
ncbi:acyltransferase family protein [Oceanisphaera sp. KMM 10153]|uniref:acyltransferase family protein n=1 Tax=Oceanisphaera submarina TaxID=3390193 RepID=UPI0039754162